MNKCYQLEPWKQTSVKSNWSKYKLFIHKNAFENVAVAICPGRGELTWIQKSMRFFIIVIK